MADRFDIVAFVHKADLVAQVVRAEELFSLLNRQLVLPTDCFALVWSGAAAPTIMAAGETIESRGVREVLLVRAVPFGLQQEVSSGLISRDGHAVQATVDFSVHVVIDRAELVAFRTAVMGSGREVTTARLSAYCQEALRSALSEYVQSRDAAELTQTTGGAGFGPFLAKHFQPVGFTSGLALSREVQASFASPAYAEVCRRHEAEQQRRQRETEELQRRQAATEARRAHLDEVETLLARLARLSAERPGVSTRELIKTFDPALRGTLYEGLLALRKPARRTAAVLLVAGDEVLWFDPAQPGASGLVRRQTLSTAGALRSIRTARSESRTLVLVGARRGVHLLERDGQSPRTYREESGPEPRGGFNAAVLLGDRLFATHSEIGLVGWKVGSPQPAPGERLLGELTNGAKTVRDVQLDGQGGLWFSADSRVIGWRPDRNSPPMTLTAQMPVTALLVAEGCVYAGLEDGSIVQWDLRGPAAGEILRGPTGRSVQTLEWSAGAGIPRLVLADGSACLESLVLGDAHVGEYRCPQRLRWGWVADDYLVAVNDRRDQVFLWRADLPQEPSGVIPVGRLCSRTIQDAALLPVEST